MKVCVQQRAVETVENDPRRRGAAARATPFF
jgi:hypothetical protein